MSMWTYIWLTGLGLFFVVEHLNERRRAAAIKKLALQLGFHYLGRAVPGSLTLSGTQLACATSIWNVIDGERQGMRIIVFDCRIGDGKGSWRRTAIAAEATTDVFGAVKFDTDLTIEHSGRWIILFQPRTFAFIPPGLMPVAEVEAHLNAIGPLTPIPGYPSKSLQM